MTVTSAGPHANQLHLASDRQPLHCLITQCFTGRMLFLTLSQQCQSTEGRIETSAIVYFSRLVPVGAAAG